jgi:hypothetical protein
VHVPLLETLWYNVETTQCVLPPERRAQLLLGEIHDALLVTNKTAESPVVFNINHLLAERRLRNVVG